MQNPDTPEHALALLDRSVLMRLDPDPWVGQRVNAQTGEPVLVGRTYVNPELYLSILGLMERSASILLVLGRRLENADSDRLGGVPRVTSALFLDALSQAAACAQDQSDVHLVAALDELMLSEAFAAVHRALARLVASAKLGACDRRSGGR